MATNKSLVIIPTYNESANIAKIIRNLLDLSVASLDILIVDDNSPDGTAMIVSGLEQRYPGRVGLLSRSTKQGLGPAYAAGFDHALANGYERVIQMDADFSHDPSAIMFMLEDIKYYDLVVGSRYIKGGRIEGWSPIRFWISRIANIYTNMVLGFEVRDFTAGFNCWRADVLRVIDYRANMANGYAFQIQIKYKAIKQGFGIREIPITFRERHEGRSKMSNNIIHEALFSVLALRFRK